MFTLDWIFFFFFLPTFIEFSQIFTCKKISVKQFPMCSIGPNNYDRFLWVLLWSVVLFHSLVVNANKVTYKASWPRWMLCLSLLAMELKTWASANLKGSDGGFPRHKKKNLEPKSARISHIFILSFKQIIMFMSIFLKENNAQLFSSSYWLVQFFLTRCSLWMVIRSKYWVV